MKKNKPEKLIAFSFGSIGEFLMLLNVCQFVKNNNPKFKAIVFCTKSESFLKQISEQYDYVEVRQISSLNLWSFIWRMEVLNGAILSPFTFGEMPRKIILAEKIISLFFRTPMLGFSGLDYGNKIKKIDISFDISINFNLNILYYQNLINLLKKANFDFQEFDLSYKYNYSNSIYNNGYIVVHVMATNEKRSLPVDRWKNIAYSLVNAGFHLYFTGSKTDLEVISNICDGMENVYNLAGKLSFSELASVIKDSIVFVGVDTGITHLAGVLGVSGVIIGNNSNPTWLPYYNKNLKILTNNERCTCNKDKKGDCLVEVSGKKYLRCMYDLKDEDIVREIFEMYEKNTSHNK